MLKGTVGLEGAGAGYRIFDGDDQVEKLQNKGRGNTIFGGGAS